MRSPSCGQTPIQQICRLFGEPVVITEGCLEDGVAPSSAGFGFSPLPYGFVTQSEPEQRNSDLFVIRAQGLLPQAKAFLEPAEGLVLVSEFVAWRSERSLVRLSLASNFCVLLLGAFHSLPESERRDFWCSLTPC